jgi:hypothetical protein
VRAARPASGYTRTPRRLFHKGVCYERRRQSREDRARTKPRGGNHRHPNGNARQRHRQGHGAWTLIDKLMALASRWDKNERAQGVRCRLSPRPRRKSRPIIKNREVDFTGAEGAHRNTGTRTWRRSPASSTRSSRATASAIRFRTVHVERSASIRSATCVLFAQGSGHSEENTSSHGACRRQRQRRTAMQAYRLYNHLSAALFAREGGARLVRHRRTMTGGPLAVAARSAPSSTRNCSFAT